MGLIPKRIFSLFSSSNRQEKPVVNGQNATPVAKQMASEVYLKSLSSNQLQNLAGTYVKGVGWVPELEGQQVEQILDTELKRIEDEKRKRPPGI